MLDDPKIKSQAELALIVNHLKEQGKKIVAFNGAFDVLHLGHINSLIRARAKGDVLVLLVNSDKSVKSYKGPTRPIISETDRVKILAALECVDYVTLFDEINPKVILDKIKPNILCKGEDWGKDCIEREVVEKNGGEIVILEKEYATTDLIKKIIDFNNLAVVKAVFFSVNLVDDKIESDFSFDQIISGYLKKIRQVGYKVIVLVRSSIKDRIINEKDRLNVCQEVNNFFKSRDVIIDGVYQDTYCLSDSEYNYEKCGISMLMCAVEELGVSLNNSWFIGENELDVKIGREINIKTIKLGERMKNFEIEPYYYVNGFQEALGLILGH